MPVELDEVENYFDARTHARTQHRQRGKADAACCARSGGCSAVCSCCPLDDICPHAKRAVELDHLDRAGTLLRCIDHRRAQWAVQRVVHIDGDRKSGRSDFGMQPSDIKLRGASDMPAAGIKARAVLIARDCAKCGEKAGPSIGARAATDADDDVAASVIEGLRYHLSEAIA